MNILFMYPAMFHPHRGGIERVSDLLCREFIKRGHHVLFLHNLRDETLLDYPYPAETFFFPNPSIQELEENGLYFRDFLEKKQIDIVINQDFQSYHKLCVFARNVENVYIISVVHTNPLNIYDYLCSLILRLRNTSVLEKFKRIARIVKIPRLKYLFLRELKVCYEDSFTYTDFICLLSWKFIPELKKMHLKNLDINRVVAIGNPNTYPFQAPFNISKKKQILFVGRITWYQKRVDRLVHIWKNLYRDYPDWELILVGDGPAKSELEIKFAKMERVYFMGYQDPEPYYKNASILCLTSNFEGWGMVLTEAMTFGTIPVVFNSFAAVTDIIEDGRTGLLVPPFSCKQFAQKLSMLMNNEELRIEMSETCMQFVKRFDIKNIADKWEEVFNLLKTEKR